MKRKTAWAVMAGLWAGIAYSIGVTVRGPYAGEHPGRNLAAGSGVLGALWLAQWAARELSDEQEE